MFGPRQQTEASTPQTCFSQAAALATVHRHCRSPGTGLMRRDQASLPSGWAVQRSWRHMTQVWVEMTVLCWQGLSTITALLSESCRREKSKGEHLVTC